MSRSVRIGKVVALALIAIMSSAGLAASAANPGPSDYNEWLDRLFAANTAPQGGFTAVAAGGSHSCALTSAKNIECWGDNEFGQATPPAGTFTSIATATAHSCALGVDQLIKCWGKDEHGRITPPAGKFTSIAAESAHSCGIRDTFKTISCWGYNSNGQTTAPTGVAFKAVTAGGFHSCGIKLDGKIACWGLLKTGPAGPAIETFTAIAAGGLHTCALNQDKAIKCWGGNDEGQNNSPTGSYEAIASGSTHSCAKKSDQTLTCWGNFEDGRTTVPSGTFNTISAGRSHSCGVMTSLKVVCWGADTHGQATDQDIRTTSDPWVTQYVTNLEAQLTSTEAESLADLNALTNERNKLLAAPVCDLKNPAGQGKAIVATAKKLTGTVRWSSPAVSAKVSITISRSLGGRTEYWNRPGKWTTTPVAKTVTATQKIAGLNESKWSMSFRVPDTIGSVYTVSCGAIDSTTNTSPTPDIAKMTGTS